MDSVLTLQHRIWRNRNLPVVVISLMLLLLGLTIYVGTVHLRQRIRVQMTKRDGEILHAVALMQQIAEEEESALGGEIEHFADQFNVALQISQLNKGVMAARLYDAQGKFRAAFPAHVTPGHLSPPHLQELRRLKPVSRFDPEGSLADLFSEDYRLAVTVPATAPLLEVFVPLHRHDAKQLTGVVEFVIDGSGIAAEFAALDRSLLIQAGGVFLAGGTLIVVALTWAFRRLQDTNRLLVERSRRLLRANEELALAAKTSAVGAVTSHLIHGLTNPLAGLQDFVASRGAEEESDAEWQTAIASTRRMQSLLENVVRVLGEELAVEHYDITLAELLELVTNRLGRQAREAQVKLLAESPPAEVVANREANLIILILDNLVQNAIEATPAGKTVRLRARKPAEGIVFEVEDEGPGFPESLRELLFRPCPSTKEGGTGIGLAICKQLANHLGAELELARSSAAGALFALKLTSSSPKTVLASARLVG